MKKQFVKCTGLVLAASLMLASCGAKEKETSGTNPTGTAAPTEIPGGGETPENIDPESGKSPEGGDFRK